MLVLVGLGVGEDTLCGEVIELRELLLPRAPKDFRASFSCCVWFCSLAGRGKLDSTTL